MSAEGRLELLERSPSTLRAIGERGVTVPRYDRRSLRPRILHFGAGGFHRAHLAVYTHELAAKGSGWGSECFVASYGAIAEGGAPRGDGCSR